MHFFSYLTSGGSIESQTPPLPLQKQSSNSSQARRTSDALDSLDRVAGRSLAEPEARSWGARGIIRRVGEVGVVTAGGRTLADDALGAVTDGLGASIAGREDDDRDLSGGQVASRGHSAGREIIGELAEDEREEAEQGFELGAADGGGSTGTGTTSGGGGSSTARLSRDAGTTSLARGTIAARLAGGTVAARLAGGTVAARLAGGAAAARLAGGAVAARLAGGAVAAALRWGAVAPRLAGGTAAAALSWGAVATSTIAWGARLAGSTRAARLAGGTWATRLAGGT